MASILPVANYPLPSQAALAAQYVGQKLEDLPTPAVVLDRAIVRGNCHARSWAWDSGRMLRVIRYVNLIHAFSRFECEECGRMQWGWVLSMMRCARWLTS